MAWQGQSRPDGRLSMDLKFVVDNRSSSARAVNLYLCDVSLSHVPHIQMIQCGSVLSSPSGKVDRLRGPNQDLKRHCIWDKPT
jgi:hypothetical protein